MQSYTCSGNLGCEPRWQSTGGGDGYALLQVADNASDSSNGDSKSTTWIPVKVWGKQGENCCVFLKKGDQVTIFGEWRYYTKTLEGKDYKMWFVKANDRGVVFPARPQPATPISGPLDAAGYPSNPTKPSPTQHRRVV